MNNLAEDSSQPVVIVPETNAESPPPYDIVCEPGETRKLGPNEAAVDVPDADIPPPPYNGNDGVIKVHAVVHNEEPESEEVEVPEAEEKSKKDEITKSESK